MNSAEMTIPPELAALQRYAGFLNGGGPIDDRWFGEPHPELKGMFWWRAGFKKCVDDVARAWHQRASGEAKPMAWRWVGENLSERWWTGMPSVTDIALAKRKGWTIEYVYSHPADTSALRECLRDMIDWLDDGNRQLSDACITDVERARTLLAGEGNG